MHEILTNTRANLTDRAAELEALIKAGEERCQATADDGNQQIKLISEKSVAEINAIREELEKHIAELNGVKHSTATIDAIAEKVAPAHLDRAMTQAEAEAVMRRHQQEDDAITLDRFTGKKNT